MRQEFPNSKYENSQGPQRGYKNIPQWRLWKLTKTVEKNSSRSESKNRITKDIPNHGKMEIKSLGTSYKILIGKPYPQTTKTWNHWLWSQWRRNAYLSQRKS